MTQGVTGEAFGDQVLREGRDESSGEGSGRENPCPSAQAEVKGEICAGS